MNNYTIISTVILISAAQYSCNYDCGDADCSFNRSEWELIQEMSPMPEPPADPTNKYWNSDAAAALGQKLFFEKRYAGTIKVGVLGKNGGLGAEGEKGKVSCASCHMPQTAFMDTRTNPNNVSLGVGFTGRNTPSLINTVYYDWHGWTGRQDTLWNQSSTSPESADNTGGDRCDYARMLFNHYREEYDAVFDEDLPVEMADTSTNTPLRFPLKCKPKSAATAPDGPWELMPSEDRQIILRVMANYAKAIAAYEMRLVSRDAPFDRYVGGEVDAISPGAKRGLKLFVGKAACNECHFGPMFTDQGFHNLGLRQMGINIPPVDEGRFGDLGRLISHPLNSMSAFSDGPNRVNIEGLQPREEDMGTFRTPMLRGVAETAPYFHTGAAETLEDVIRYYNEGGGDSGFSGSKDVRLAPLDLTEDEISDLAEFLTTLTGEPIAEYLTENPLE